MKTTETELTIKSTKLSKSVRLEYVEQGDPAGVPVLLLHGITDSWRSYELVLPYLPRVIHAFALSQRGHGDADRPAVGYHPRDFAADIAAFMDAHKLERAVLVGHSMSSLIAQRFALDYPARVLGLVLVGAFINLRSNPGTPELAQAFAQLTDPINPEFARAFQESTLAQPIPQPYLNTITAESLKVPARVWRAAMTGVIETDHRAEIKQIKAPTLIIWGDQEVFCPRQDQETLAATIADARLIVYPGAGHALHWEEPDHFAADLTTFIESLAHRAQSSSASL